MKMGKMKMGKWSRWRSAHVKRYGGNKKLRARIMRDDLRNAKAPPDWMKLLFSENEQEDDEEIAG